MVTPPMQPRPATARDLLFISMPELWQTWPHLPLVRCRPDGEFDCGVLYDFSRTAGTTSQQATVFLENLFLVPESETELLKLPKEEFATFDELLQAGWRVD